MLGRKQSKRDMELHDMFKEPALEQVARLGPAELKDFQGGHEWEMS